jgi:hypothetical protein
MIIHIIVAQNMVLCQDKSNYAKALLDKALRTRGEKIIFGIEENDDTF